MSTIAADAVNTKSNKNNSNDKDDSFFQTTDYMPGTLQSA